MTSRDKGAELASRMEGRTSPPNISSSNTGPNGIFQDPYHTVSVEESSKTLQVMWKTQTLSDILNSFLVALHSKRYNQWHDLVLSHICDLVDVDEDCTVVSDLSESQSYIFPPVFASFDLCTGYCDLQPDKTGSHHYCLSSQFHYRYTNTENVQKQNLSISTLSSWKRWWDLGSLWQ